jgi:hypothetical protein
MCTIMMVSNVIPALLADEAADEIYATPDLRITTTIAPTGQAVPVEGGYRVTGQWTWNTAGVHSNWFTAACVVPGEEDSGLRAMLMPTTDVEHQDNWRSAGMVGRPQISRRSKTCSSPRRAPSSSKILPRATIPPGATRVCPTSTGRS